MKTLSSIHRHAICTLAAAIYSVSHSAFAANILELSDLSTLSLRQLLDVSVEVSSLHDESILHAPSSVTVFNRREIMDLGVRTVEELLNFVPGFQSSRETFINQASRVSARGTLNPQPSYNILFLMDGQRMNSDLSGGALFDNRLLTVANIERVEVIRGPGSALYGTSAFSGVVNIITSRDSNDAYIGAGSLNSREMYVNRSIHQGDWQASGFVRYYEDDGQSYGADLTNTLNPAVNATRDPYSALDFYATLSWDDRIRINARHAQRDMDDFISFQFIQNGVAGNESYTDSISLKAKLFERKNWGLDLQLGYMASMMEEVEKLGPNLGTYEYASSEWELKLDGHYNFAGNQLRSGISYRRPETDKWRFVNAATGAVLPNGPEDGRDIVGIYVQDQFNLTPQLHVTLGARIDWYSKVGSSLNPRAALVYTPNSATGLKLLYGEAFRAPNRFQSDDVFAGNSSINSEKIRTLELVWLQDYSNWLPQTLSIQTSATLFRSWHENRIKITPGPGLFGFLASNDTSTLVTSGLETEVTAGIGANLSLRASYTYLPETEEDPQSFASNKFTLIANYHRRDWSFNINAQYHSEMQQLTGSSNITLNDHWLVNTSAGLHLNKKLKLIARIYNLSDETFHSPTSVPNLNTGVENRGRTFSLGLEYLW